LAAAVADRAGEQSEEQSDLAIGADGDPPHFYGRSIVRATRRLVDPPMAEWQGSPESCAICGLAVINKKTDNPRP
jgi:hypothetical protein